MTKLLKTVNKSFENFSINDKRKIRNELNLKNIKSVIKFARDAGINLGKRIKTQQKRAFNYARDIYNDIVDEKNKVIKEERREKKKTETFKKSFIKDLTNKNERIIRNPSQERLRTTLNIMKDKFLRDGKRYNMVSGKKHYSLNDATVSRLIDNLDELYLETATQGVGSDIEIIDIIKDVKSVKFYEYVGLQGNLLKEYAIQGSFFKYTHNIKDLDLSDLQIYEDFKASYYTENCFIHSLLGVVNEKIINDCKLIIKSKETRVKDIKQIAEKHNLYICVRVDDSHYRHYNKKGSTKINLGLLDEHYFIIKKIPVNSFALKNYFDICDKEDWNKIFRIRKDGVRREERFIDSYNVVKILLDNKDTHLKKIVKCDELYKTEYFDKITDIESLEYGGNNIRENVYAEKESGLRIKVGEAGGFSICRIIPYNNVFFDFETNPHTKPHTPFLVRCCFATNNGGVRHKAFYGKDCGLEMLRFLGSYFRQQPLKLIAHNLGYDINFIAGYVANLELIESGSMCKGGTGVFYLDKNRKVPLKFQDSFALIPTKLSKFKDMFGIETEKEFIPYNLLTAKNIENKYISFHKVKEGVIKQTKQNCIGYNPPKSMIEKNYNLMMHNGKKWDCIHNNKFDIVKYCDEYCKCDCEVLKQGYEKFCEMIKEVCDMNADAYMTIAQLADDYLKKEGCYDGVYMVNGVVREFIQLCMVGGRTMCANNEKQYQSGVKIDDYDACSLYPSAMERLGGFLLGRPKVLKQLDYDFLKNQDGYFVEIKIKQIPKHYRFPLISYKNNEGVRVFSDNVEDYKHNSVYVDKTTLEDLIKFYEDNNSPRDFKFDIIKGYYYDEGRNMKLKPVIQHLYNTRLEMKAEGNPIQNIYKLLMNSSYGKSLLKPIDNEIHYIYTKKKADKFIMNNYTRHIETDELTFNDMWRVKVSKTIDKHFNNALCGVEVLSMSKRIMNEVMCLGEDIGIDIYYQDTDSMHLKTEDVPKLENKFKEIYDRDLNGKNMGQFHTDFDSKVLKGDIYSKCFIALGKKCYLDVLTDDTGKEDYHIRMKGVSGDSVKYHAKGDIKNLYDRLYNNEALPFDLCCNNLKACFEKNSDFTIKSKDSFWRVICFDDDSESKKEKIKGIQKLLK